MGLFSWFRGNRGKSPPPPWVRPEFLGVFALVTIASIGIGYWNLGGGSEEPVASGPAQQEYVGMQPHELLGELPCEPNCYVEMLLTAWQEEHPQAEIVQKEPRYFQGIIIGYDIVYRLA